MDLESLKGGTSSESDPLVSVRGSSWPKNKSRRSALHYLLLLAILIALIVVGLALGLGLGLGLRSKETEGLVNAIKTDNLMGHLKELQSIADKYENASLDRPQSRAVQYAYNESAEYVISVLEKHNYEPKRQYFTVPIYEQLERSNFTAAVPNVSYTWTFLEGVEYSLMRYSGSGQVNNILTPIMGEPGGCDESDFADLPSGAVALLNYTTNDEHCSLYQRVINAKTANASAVVMMRQMDDPNANFPPTSRIYTQNGTGIFTVNLPIVGASYPLGQKLFELLSLAGGDLTVTIETATSVTEHVTYNVLAYTSAGRNDSIIVTGTHLDSVPAGPGINDNGSGSSANLEMAIQLANLDQAPKNKVLFAWWGAEELGLFGSTHFVMNLTAEEMDAFACNLNFDMIGSPNYARMIYNGSQADEMIRNSSITIQGLFEERFKSQNLEYELTPFTGRSDYGPFIENGIPAGGLFTGAEVKKTMEQQKKYGGFANAQLDPCYHQACDTYENVNTVVFIEMAQAAAYALNMLMDRNNIREFLNSTSL